MSWFYSGNERAEAHIISLVKVDNLGTHTDSLWKKKSKQRTKSNVETHPPIAEFINMSDR